MLVFSPIFDWVVSLLCYICKVWFKGKLRSKKNKLKWENVKNAKTWAITDLNAPNSSRDIQFQGNEFEQHGPPFCRFLASFSIKCDVTYAILQDIEKWKYNTSRVFCLICLKFCRLLEVNKRISLDFKFHCYGNSNDNN